MFTVRIYVLLQHLDKYLLLHEPFMGKMIYKFPGGGLELGETTHECLHRELKEELNLKITNLKHLYTQDIAIVSAQNPDLGVFLVYYTATIVNISDLKIQDPVIQSINWCNLKQLDTYLSLETDKKAVAKLTY